MKFATRFLLRAAHLTLGAEIVLQALWLPVVVWLVGLMLLASGALTGTSAKIFAPLITLLCIGLIIVRLRHTPWPKAEIIARRIEKVSHLPHRPLALLEDAPTHTAPDDLSKNIYWQAAQRHASAQLTRLRLPWPQPNLGARDQWALRCAVILLAVAVFGVMGAEGRARVADAYHISALFGPINLTQSTARLHITLTPPPYTGLAPLTITEHSAPGNALDTPTGTRVQAKVTGGALTPSLHIGSRKIKAQEISQRLYALDSVVQDENKIALRQWPFGHLSFTLNPLPDQKPTVALDAPPEALPDGQTRLALKVQDDYGVRAVHITIAPEGPHSWLLPQDYTGTQTLLAVGRKDADVIRPVFDFGWHPQAGQNVTLTVTVRDDLGQSASVRDIPFTLPLRRFNAPIARAIVAVRQTIIDTPDSLTPKRAAYALEGLTASPEDFRAQIVPYIALRVAVERLKTANNPDQLAEVVPLLWAIALALDGQQPFLETQKELRAAQENLARLLNDPNAKPDDVAQALEDYQQALANAFRALLDQMQKQMPSDSALTRLAPQMLDQTLSPDFLGKKLQEMQQALAEGNRDKAAEIFSELQKMMDALASGASGEMPQGAEHTAKAIEDLQKLIDQQQDLLDQTQEQVDKQKDGKETDTQKNATEQEALRYILGQLMREIAENLPEVPENLVAAEQAMRESAAALQNNNPKGALSHQQAALDALRQSQGMMQQSLKMALQNMMMIAPGLPHMARDALGREDGRAPSGERVNIPKESKRRKIQDILEQLRTRAGERDRPTEERDYYKRLLDLF